MLLVSLINGRLSLMIYLLKYFQKMKPLRWLLSYVVTNHLVNQAKTRITNRLNSSYTAFSRTKINEIHFIRGLARFTSYFFFRGKEVSLERTVCPSILILHKYVKAIEYGLQNGTTKIKSGFENVTEKSIRKSNNIKHYIQTDLKQHIQRELKRGWEEGKSQTTKKLK